jgi:hypothetical protein
MSSSSIELLSTELVFEIFDYLTPYDIFHGFMNLTARFNDTIGHYPMQLDFQSISRAKFDFICRRIQPKQVTAIILSDEKMPHQCELFKRYFPRFAQEFFRLKTLTFNNTSSILSHLPQQVSSLCIRTYLKTTDTDNLITEILNRQAPFLTSLKVEGSYVFRSIANIFTLLTHLSIDYCTRLHFNQLVPYIPSTLTYLRLFFEEETLSSILDFRYFSTYLTHLTLTFSDSKITMMIQ